MTITQPLPRESANAAGAQNGPAPANHSLLKKGAQDDTLLRAYSKVERKLDGLLARHLSNIIECKMAVELGAFEPGRRFGLSRISSGDIGNADIGPDRKVIFDRLGRLFLWWPV